MARIRTIKPSFWSDATLSTVSRDARLLAVGLISFADDEGRFVAASGAILGYVFPLDPSVTPAKVKAWRDELADRGIVHLYVVGGFEYGCWPNWKKHQVINKPRPSTFPPPTPLPEESGSDAGSAPTSLLRGREGKGREEKLLGLLPSQIQPDVTREDLLGLVENR